MPIICAPCSKAEVPSPSSNKTNRQRPLPFDAERYKWRNVIERTNCRIKDFRAIATRYDKLARNFLAGLCLVTALIYWGD